MTDKDTLMNLIDEYAEARHINGCWVYNSKTAAARQAVIEALRGVQALSAAPEAIAKLRHLYQNMVNGAVRDTASAKRIAEGLLAPAIEALERATPPAEQPIGEVVVTKTKDGQIVAVTRQDDEGRILSVIATSDPAEQQAEESRVKLLAECRDAFPIPEPSSPLEVQWAAAMARPEEVPEYVRLCVAEMQAAPKAAPWERLTREQIREVFMAHGFTIKEGQTDLKQYVYEAAHALLELVAAPQQGAQEPALFVSPKQLAALTDPDDPEGEHGRYLPARKTSKGLFTQPLYAAPQPAPTPLSEMPYEKRKAIQEGEQIGASDAWFHARLNMLDTLDRRNVFRAGFDRGWNAALAAQGGQHG